LRYVFQPEDELGKSHKFLSINAFKAQGVSFEYSHMKSWPGSTARAAANCSLVKALLQRACFVSVPPSSAPNRRPVPHPQPVGPAARAGPPLGASALGALPVAGRGRQGERSRRWKRPFDFLIGGFSPPEGRLARGFKPPAFSRFLFQSAVQSAESF